MAIKEGFKQTEIGEIPVEWSIEEIGETFEFSRKPRSLEISDDDIIPFIPMDSISEVNEDVSYYEEKKWNEISSGSYVEKDDLIVAKITPSFENGKQALLKKLPKDFGYATTEVWALHPKKENKVETDFLYYFLKKKDVRINLSNKMEGSTGRQRVPRSTLANFKIPVPSLPEQKAIAQKLTVIRNAIEQTQAVIEATGELKKSMMKHLFTYGPVPVDQTDQVELKETDIGLVPKEWEKKKLGEISDIKSGGTPSRKNDEYWKNGNIPWIKTGEVDYRIINDSKEKITQKGLENSSANLFPIGTILIAMYGQGVTRGRVGKLGVEASTNQACAAFLNLKSISNDFLFYVLQYEYERLRMHAHGANQKNLSGTLLKQFEIHVPDQSTQNKMVNILTEIDSKISVEKDRYLSLEKLFDSTLESLMTAKKRVN